MAISFPIVLPSATVGSPVLIVLQAPDLGKWEVRVTNDGVFQTVSGATGAPNAPKIKALDGGVWQLKVTNLGLLQTEQSSGDTSEPRVRAPNGRDWFMQVKNNGVLQSRSQSSARHLISRIRWRPRSVVGMAQSIFTLQQQAQVHQGQILAGEVDISMLVDPADFEPLSAVLLSLNGREGKFLLGDPVRAFPRGVPTGAPVVDGAGQTGRKLNARGFVASSAGVLKAKDWIQLGAGETQRIYAVLQDVDADVNGKAVIDIFPRLRESPANGEVLILDHTQGVFRLSENVMSWEVEPPEIHDFSFAFHEAF